MLSLTKFRYECVNVQNPYSRRLLFYYYVLMMDSSDLDLQDPKRSELEQDRIVLEFVITQLRTLLNQLDIKGGITKESAESEANQFKKAVIEYKLEQKRILRDVIAVYEEDYYRLIKEDAL